MASILHGVGEVLALLHAASSCLTHSTMPLPKGIAFALEKPLATDLRSAKSLNRLLQRMLPDEQLFGVNADDRRSGLVAFGGPAKRRRG